MLQVEHALWDLPEMDASGGMSPAKIRTLQKRLENVYRSNFNCRLLLLSEKNEMIRKRSD